MASYLKYFKVTSGVIIFLLISVLAYYIIALNSYDKTAALYDYLDKNCSNGCKLSVSEFLDNEIDYLIIFDMFYFDMAKNCDEIKISPIIKQHMMHNLHCGYVLVVKEEQVTSFFKRKCMSESKPPYVDFTHISDYLTPSYQALDTVKVKVSNDIVKNTPYYFLTPTTVIKENTFDCVGDYN